MQSLSRGGIRAAVLHPARWVNWRPVPAPSARNWHQGGSSPPCPVGELAPFSTPSARHWRPGGSFPPCPVGELAPFPRTVCPGSGVRTVVPRLCPVGESAPCPRPRQLGTGGRAAVLRSVQRVSLPPCSTPSARNRRPGGSLSSCRTGGHQNSPSHALRHFKLRNPPPFFPLFRFHA